MNIDIMNLKEFYESPISINVYSIVRNMLNRLRNVSQNNKTLFLGFGDPYADERKDEFLLMQAHIGVLAWPNSKNNRALLSYENDWPFADHVFDEIIIIHGLEYSQHAGNLLAECYRCLKPEGRLSVVVPNKRGIWVRSDKNPFGFGQHFTLTQLSELLKKFDFIPVHTVRGLYSFPFSTVLGSLGSWIFECIASRTLQKFSGLVGIAAIKRVYAGIPAKKILKDQRLIITQPA